jgi:hypothetical protein
MGGTAHTHTQPQEHRNLSPTGILKSSAGVAQQQLLRAHDPRAADAPWLPACPACTRSLHRPHA